MLISKDKLNARIAELEVAFMEAKRNSDELLGAIKECKGILVALDMPEPSDPAVSQIKQGG